MFQMVIELVGELRVLSTAGLPCLSFLLPLTIFIGRSNIKNLRQKIIVDLEAVFRIDGNDTDKLIPPFEFAAYKHRALPHQSEGPQPSEWRAYFLPVTVFIMVTFSGFVLACITALTLHHGYMDVAQATPAGAVADRMPELIVAFLVGFFPRLGLQTLLSQVPQLQIRRLDPRAQGFVREYPIDMIMGIDSPIKFRLAEFEIERVPEPVEG